MICDTKESTINARIPEEYKQQISELAKLNGITQSEFVRRSLQYSLEMVKLTRKG